MSTIIRRDPNDRPGKTAARLLLRVAAALLIVAIVVLLGLAWQRGAPLPVREVAVPLAAPAAP